MAPRQNTFTLVPNPLGMQGLMSRPANGPESKPPMTSKQAQKLYKQANRGPRLSKAEQRRFEREEQDRIRRELDKDKQANKARILREKKKAREQQALDEKRRKGLPLVTVQPSQDTISRFVRGNGVGKKRDVAGTKVDLPVVEEQEEKAQGDRSSNEDLLDENIPPKQFVSSESKRRCLDHDLRDENGGMGRMPGVKGVDIVAKAIELTGGDCNPESPPKAGAISAIPPAQSQAPGDGSPRPPPKDVVPTTSGTISRNQENETLRPGEMEPEEKPRPEEKGGSRGATPGETTEVEKTSLASSSHSSRPPEIMVHAKPTKVVDETLAEETPTKIPNIAPLRQGTPAQGISGLEKTRSTTPKPLLSGPSVSPMPFKTPVNKQIQTPKPPHPTHRSIPPPQQQRPSPKPVPVQRPATRKPLQDITTTSFNRIRPAASTDSTSKLRSSYKPVTAIPQRQTPTTVPAFKHPIQGTAIGRVQKSQFLPAHLRNATSHPRPVSPASAGKQQARRPRDDFMSAPPTSTQLFVMSHIDDLFPSPSQEARELRDPPAAAVEPPKPGAVRPPIAGYAAKPSARPGQLPQEATRVKVPMAPPPRPTTAKQAAVKPTETPDIPFISTQDLVFSSQDLRELEEPTITPSKTGGNRNNNAPPFKSRSTNPQRPSPLSHSSPRTFVQNSGHQFRTKHPTPSRRPPTHTRATGPQRPDREKGGCDSNQSSVAKNQQLTQNNESIPRPCQNSRAVVDQPALAAPQRPPSPEKPQFFGSSGSGVEQLYAQVALERSRKTHEEEEKRRRHEPDSQASLDRNKSVGLEQGKGKRKEHMENKHKTREEQGQALGPQRGPLQRTNSNTKATGQGKITASGQPEAPQTASQETDYGDPELDSIDFDDLGLGLF
ncbi:hypothetical protein C8A00DRAFT_14001 [Chaetomidium leptoderma]|uniref:Uncharacterized protein n=1 Tax=Chaetomidium leptoderma TaxID=669021 RepID=A0AAN6VPI3_9PEZI|nr:hypothetical protein C8A00DRAFT_14001 [Chaetomidium leptoderma]